VSSSPRKKHIVKKEIDLEITNGDVVKAEEVVVEKDDVETTVEIKSEEIGNVALNGIPDIEDIGRSA
jgi:endonuclease-3